MEVSVSLTVDVYEPLFTMSTLIDGAHITESQFDAFVTIDPTGYLATYAAQVSHSHSHSLSLTLTHSLTLSLLLTHSLSLYLSLSHTL